MSSYTSNSINILIPFGVLLMPGLDMTFVILKRLYMKKSPFFPDRSHLHHVILNTGMSHKNTVYTIQSITTIIIVFTMIKLEINFLLILLAVITLAFIILYVELFNIFEKMKKKYFKKS